MQKSLFIKESKNKF